MVEPQGVLRSRNPCIVREEGREGREGEGRGGRGREGEREFVGGKGGGVRVCVRGGSGREGEE